jgi:dTDP-4-amino-4,6-dideoxygalactose transaminase
MNSPISYNVPPLAGDEFDFIKDAIERKQISGDGYYTRSCESWIETRLKVPRTLLTHSCTAALEMAALLANLSPGDEVIMPSFTFVSTANAVALRGAIPVFVDIRPDTLNIDETRIEAAITPKTRAIMVVHYAGVCAEMDEINQIAARHQLLVIEDSAHAFLATYRGRLAGTLGDLACLSFHETKNVVSGEGGALLVNRPQFTASAEIIREKGTNRKQFLQGLVDKYSWVGLGSSYVPSEITAAFLYAQLNAADRFTADRRETWDYYYKAFADAERRGLVSRPRVPSHCVHNGHIFYLLMPTPAVRNEMLAVLNNDGINAIFHYVPLHSSEAGKRYGRAAEPLAVTDDIASRLIRLPIWFGIGEKRIRVVERVLAHLLKDAQCLQSAP